MSNDSSKLQIIVIKYYRYKKNPRIIRSLNVYSIEINKLYSLRFFHFSFFFLFRKFRTLCI